ncbi:MAG: HEAT repeat domain-containing protein [Janthinobacterium lividum]
MEDQWPDYYADPVGHCIAAFKYGNENERFNAADILRGLAGDAYPAIPVIVKAMRHDDSYQVRAQCAFALADIGSALKERANSAVLPLMGALVDDENAEMRSLAATALGAIGPAAREAIPVLEQALQDKHEWVRAAAEDALHDLRNESRPPRS